MTEAAEGRNSSNTTPQVLANRAVAPFRRGADDVATVPNMVTGLNALWPLIGTWASPSYSKQGFNVMPLPEVGGNDGLGFILKNFHYYETMRFNLLGKVPNRGGAYQQDCYTLLYEQRVFFAEGPATGTLVHGENGAWLRLQTAPQFAGPYGGPGQGIDPIQPGGQPPQGDLFIAKQVSVPHGNSLLLLGDIPAPYNGAPTIPDLDTLPTDKNGKVVPRLLGPYERAKYAPIVKNPNAILQQFVEKSKNSIIRSTEVRVSTKAKGGGIKDIPFIENHANITSFDTILWILEMDDQTYRLLYSQNAVLQFPLKELKLENISFPHATVGILSRAETL